MDVFFVLECKFDRMWKMDDNKNRYHNLKC